MAGVKVSLNNGAASSPLFAGGNDNEKKKKTLRGLISSAPRHSPLDQTFLRARLHAARGSEWARGRGRGVRATSVVPLRPSLLHTSVAGAMRSRAEGDRGGVAKCAPENMRHPQGPT